MFSALLIRFKSAQQSLMTHWPRPYLSKAAWTTGHSGMTLLEIIIVVALLGSIMGVLVTNLLSPQDSVKEDTSRLGMGEIAQALQLYRVHNNQFPTTEQGLSALVLSPGTMPRWRGPYIEEEKLKDPWGQSYGYENSGRQFKIVSAGLDGEMGTEDDLTYPETPGSTNDS